jgi:hypothetical protein
MSFNKQNISINRSNYEEYFLFYTDGELDDQQNKMVEEFASLHPDLLEELELICATKLQPEKLIFKHKEILSCESLELNNIESMLLYIDDELPRKEAALIRQHIETDAAFKAQHDYFQQLKLDTGEKIIYPYKKELYRFTKQEYPQAWLRIAAAIFIFFSIGILFWVNTGKETMHVAKTRAIPQPHVDNDRGKKITPKTGIAQKNETVLLVKETKPSIVKNEVIYQKAPDAHKEKNYLPAPDNKTIALTNQPDINEDDIESREKQPSQQILNNPTVTTADVPTYIHSEAIAKLPAVTNAVAFTSEEKKGSFRGFLRKASRFIERRTGINPVNDDNELLIGAVAIKL